MRLTEALAKELPLNILEEAVAIGRRAIEMEVRLGPMHEAKLAWKWGAIADAAIALSEIEDREIADRG